MTKWQWIFQQFTSKLWMRATLFCFIGVFTAFFAVLAKDSIPLHISQKVGAEAVDAILQILASSMLAVTIFSLNTIVGAYAAASSSATPRATKLLLADRTAQNALSTFLGSFLFSLVGIISLHMGIYGESGRVILFFVTLLVIFVIIMTLLQWIDYLSKLGRVGRTIDMVEHAAADAISKRLQHPFLGGAPWVNETVHEPHAIPHATIGYVQHIDMKRLSTLAERNDLRLCIKALPGAFNDGNSPVMYCSMPLDDAQKQLFLDAYSIGGDRSYDQDPRYGLIVLSEIASRALSPAVNDPGTAIDVIGTAVRVLAPWLSRKKILPEVLYPRVHVLPVKTADLFDDMFAAIARDGASMVEVGLRLQKALTSLSKIGNADAQAQAMRHSKRALEHAYEALRISAEKELLNAVALAENQTMQKLR